MQRHDSTVHPCASHTASVTTLAACTRGHHANVHQHACCARIQRGHAPARHVTKTHTHGVVTSLRWTSQGRARRSGQDQSHAAARSAAAMQRSPAAQVPDPGRAQSDYTQQGRHVSGVFPLHHRLGPTGPQTPNPMSHGLLSEEKGILHPSLLTTYNLYSDEGAMEGQCDLSVLAPTNVAVSE